MIYQRPYKVPFSEIKPRIEEKKMKKKSSMIEAKSRSYKRRTRELCLQEDAIDIACNQKSLSYGGYMPRWNNNWESLFYLGFLYNGEIVYEEK
jgi:hypothetical protein